MFKQIGIILLVVCGVAVILTPVYKGLFNKDNKKDEFKEEQIIGTSYGHNPRVVDVQETLRKAGFDPGPIDGRMGLKTRNAIREFQKKKGISASGRIDSATWLALNTEKGKIKSNYHMIPTKLKDENLEGKLEYNVTKKKTDVYDEVMSYRLKSKGTAMQIQTALKNAGFYAGEIDGKIGPQTKRAIKAFQKSKGFTPDGIVGPKTWGVLREYMED